MKLKSSTNFNIFFPKVIENIRIKERFLNRLWFTMPRSEGISSFVCFGPRQGRRGNCIRCLFPLHSASCIPAWLPWLVSWFLQLVSSGQIWPNSLFPRLLVLNEIWFYLDELNVTIFVSVNCSSKNYSINVWL